MDAHEPPRRAGQPARGTLRRRRSRSPGALVGAPSRARRGRADGRDGGGAAFGLADDLGEDSVDRRKGLRGHLGALAHGEVTTGGLKVLGIGAGALVAAALATPGHRADGSRRSAIGWLADVGASGALIASSANLVNLLDLRPGRALKAVGIAAAPLALGAGAGAGAAAAVLGATAPRSTRTWPRPTCWVTVVRTRSARPSARPSSCRRPDRSGSRCSRSSSALTVASEKVSFTRVIERTPVLRELDAWGRRPVDVRA